MADNSKIASSLRLGKSELSQHNWQISVNTPEGQTCDTDFCSNAGIPLTKDNDWSVVIHGRDGADPWTAYVDTACLEAAVEGRKDIDRDGECTDVGDLFNQVNLLGKISGRSFHNENRHYKSFRALRALQASKVDGDTSTFTGDRKAAPSNE
jgi:hypothetical protein